MKISVDDKPKRFYIAASEWSPAVGHEIQVGDYRFSALPAGDRLIICEVTTGFQVHKILYTSDVLEQTDTKEKALSFLAEVGQILENAILKQEDFEELIQDAYEKSREELGNQPEIHYVDEEELKIFGI